MSAIETVTFVKDASLQYEATEGNLQMLEYTEYDDLLHLFVVYTDGTSNEWSSDWGKTKEQWVHDAWDWAIEQGKISGIYA